MTTFVLVHGAWSGAHGFRHVRRLLQAAGHTVFTPSLTGLGERVHLASPLVNLSTHVRDVVNHVLYEDLREIALVGFSYGGFVVTGALEHIAANDAGCRYAPVFKHLWKGHGSIAAGFTVDGIHPTASGYGLMASALVTELASLPPLRGTRRGTP